MISSTFQPWPILSSSGPPLTCHVPDLFSRASEFLHRLCEVGPGGVTWSGPGVKDRVSNGRMCCKELAPAGDGEAEEPRITQTSSYSL